jgi:hypothetical protein
MPYSSTLQTAFKTLATAATKHAAATTELLKRDAAVQTLLAKEATTRRFKAGTPKMSELLPDSEPPKGYPLMVLKQDESGVKSWAIAQYMGSGMFTEPDVIRWTLTPDFPAVL